MEKPLSHQLGVDVDITPRCLNAVMAQHFFDLENGSPRFQKVLSISVSEAVSGFEYTCIV